MKNKNLTKRELIKEISDKTELKPELVHSVINAFIDIFIREVIVKGQFNLSNCFSVHTKTRKEHIGYNMTTKENEIRPETKFLSMKLSKKINYMFRWKNRTERNSKLGTTPETWKDSYSNREND